MIHLDTHVVAWLYDGQIARLPRAVSTLLEENDLAVSPIVQLELEYLHEIGRLATSSSAVLDDLEGRIGLRTSAALFAQIVEHASRLSWTRDPFDRIIVGTAMADDVVLVTRDTTILDHCSLARWDGPLPGRKATGRRRTSKRKHR